MLQIGNLTYEQISYATELPEWHVASMAEEIHHEQDAIIQEIRKTIIGMKLIMWIIPFYVQRLCL